MRKLIVLLTLCLFAFNMPTQAATPQKVVFDNNTAAVLYVYIIAHNSGSYYQSNITAIPASTPSYFNMHPGSIYTPVSWPTGMVPPAGSEFWGIVYYEYDPTNFLCNPGTAVPFSGCNFISSSMDISGTTSTCMETSGSSCATVPGNTVINGTVTATYWKSMDVSFF